MASRGWRASCRKRWPMSDTDDAPVGRLESELSAMRPRPMSDRLLTIIEARLVAPPVPAPHDRMLLSAISAGAIAACVVATVVVRELVSVAPPSVKSPQAAMGENRAPRFGDSATLLARADLSAPGVTP